MKKIEIYNNGELETCFLVTDGQEKSAVQSLKVMMALANSRGGRYQYEIKG